jgi:hypothetical protein
MVSCDECGFRGETRSNADLVVDAGRFATRFTAPLTRFLPTDDVPGVLRARPEPATWSALEYAAHVRDAFGFYADRIHRVVSEDQPRLEAFGFDAACEERRYNDEEPARVAEAIAVAADELSALLRSLPEDAWERVGIGSGGEVRTVRMLAERAVHEGHHHLLDIGRSLRAARGRA